MRFAGLVLLVLLFSARPVFAVVPSAPVQPGLVAQTESDYQLGVGDVVRVEVHDEPDLTLDTQIPSTGTINYPFLGQIRVAGSSVAQLQARITEGLRGEYLVKPQVRVRVAQYRPFFVRGQVKSAGGFPYVLGLTVEKAVTLAGGFTDRASLKNIFLIRENSTQDHKVKVGLDSPVSPGDTLIVEESLF